MAQAVLDRVLEDIRSLQPGELWLLEKALRAKLAEDPTDAGAPSSEVTIPRAGLRYGMFAGEPEVTEDEFRRVEWRGEDAEI